ncbi:MAG: YihY/virulence factor BrkB family protein [Candidatus Bathyarchaeota archaeon]|nr:YihY/virulence factor BrkB family protein [Candidatus Bathyarchaeota archaeon]
MNKKDLIIIFKQALKEWLKDNSPLRAGALTFFIILPLPTLLLIILTIFEQFYGQPQSINLLIQQITAFAGPAVANLFSQLLENAASPFSSFLSSLFLILFTLIGAVGAFATLRDSIDLIWDVKRPKKQKLLYSIREKIGPFFLVSALGLLVIGWAGVATALFSIIRLFSINQTLTLITITTLQIFLSFALSTLLFAIIYKMLPQAKVEWRDVVLAAVSTGIAFTVVNYILGTYIQTFTVTTIIGAAGSLMIILLWIFILNQIVLFGAEISRVYALTFGSQRKKEPTSQEKQQSQQQPEKKSAQSIEIDLKITTPTKQPKNQQ